jgi:hypothetical protein
MKTNEPKKPSSGESPVPPAADVKASEEPEVLSRIAGEVGPKAPMSVMERIDRAFKNRLMGKDAPTDPSSEIKSKPAREP